MCTPHLCVVEEKNCVLQISLSSYVCTARTATQTDKIMSYARYKRKGRGTARICCEAVGGRGVSDISGAADGVSNVGATVAVMPVVGTRDSSREGAERRYSFMSCTTAFAVLSLVHRPSCKLGLSIWRQGMGWQMRLTGKSNACHTTQP